MPSRLRPALVGLIGAFRRTPACATAAAASLFGLLLVAACSTEGVMAMRPDVDVGAQTAAVPAPVPDVAIASVAPLPDPGLAPADPVLAPAEQTLDDQAAMLTPAPPLAPAAEPLLDTGPEEPVPDLVPEDAPIEVRPASGPARAPCTGAAADVGARKADARSLPALPGSRPGAASGDAWGRGGLPPRAEAARRHLQRPRADPEGQCGIDHPVKVSAIGSVGMKPAATLTCAMALTFAQWTKNELVPSARRRYFTGVKTIHQGSSYSCRKIADSRGVLSEHGKGNALDIMRIELNSGKDIDVRSPACSLSASAAS